MCERLEEGSGNVASWICVIFASVASGKPLVEDVHNSKDRVSISTLLADNSVKTVLGKTPVKHKKRGFHDLSGGK